MDTNFDKNSATDKVLKNDYELGLAFLEGNGVEQDIEKGFELIKKSAAGGYVLALSKIGDMALEGKYIEKNADLALQAYMSAAKEGSVEGDPHAQNMLAAYYESIEDYKSAFEYHNYAAKGGNTDSMRRLGFFYRDGINGEKDQVKSAQYFKKSADLGDATSQYIIGGYYVFGYRGMNQDIDKGIDYIRKAIANGIKDQDNLLQTAIELRNNPEALKRAAQLATDDELNKRPKITQSATDKQKKAEKSTFKKGKLRTVLSIILSLMCIALSIVILVKLL